MLKSNIFAQIQSKILILLVAGSLFMMLILGWQAYHSVHQQRIVAEKVLVEYAQLAADEFARRIMADIGYRGYFRTLNDWRSSLEESKYNLVQLKKTLAKRDCKKEKNNNLAKNYFFYVSDNQEFFNSNCGSLEQVDFIQLLIEKFDTKQLTEKPFAFIHTQLNQIPITLIVAKIKQGLYGFAVNRQQLIHKLTISLNKAPILPRVLADGKATNQMLTVNMQDHLGNSLVGTPFPYKQSLVATKALKGEYSGIFRDHIIHVAINADSTEQLIIGGLPDNNLTAVISTMVATFMVFIISLLQLKKEQRLNQLRKNFVAEVSHELRTPLTQIRMFSEMLLQGKTRNSQEKNKYLSIIHRESLRLNNLIENVLKYSETQAQRPIQLDSQDLAPIISNIINDFLPIAKEKNVILKVDIESCHIPIEIHALKQIILNLLDNAVKYGPEKQTISIQAKKTDHKYRLSITDQGAGIPANRQQQIWQAYYRLPGEHEAAIAGTGIGLYLVKQLAHQMKAKIWVKNQAEGGSQFILEWTLTSKNGRNMQ